MHSQRDRGAFGCRGAECERDGGDGDGAEHGAHGIAIAPGYFATEMNTALLADAQFTAWVNKRTPAGRWGDPAEIAGLAVFFASPASDYVTGQILFSDGGMSVAL